MNLQLRKSLILLFTAGLLINPTGADAANLETRYASVIYEDIELLQIFHRKVKLGGIRFSFGQRVNTNLPGEVRKKINQLNGRVQEILEMKPHNMRFRIVLLPNRKEVQKIYKEQYNRKVDFIAFYSPLDKTVYLSVKDLRLRVYVHEVAHAVIDHYFEIAPPVKIHEMLAQYVEAKI